MYEHDSNTLNTQHSQIFASKQMQKYTPGFTDSSSDVLLWSRTAVLKIDKVSDFEMTCSKLCLLKLHQIPLQLIKRGWRRFGSKDGFGPYKIQQTSSYLSAS